jgi:hypothetical protein
VRLGDEAHGGECVDSPEAAQSAHHLGVSGILADLLDLGVEAAMPLLEVLDGQSSRTLWSSRW